MRLAAAPPHMDKLRSPSGPEAADMSPLLKLLVRLAAVPLMGWVSHGPLGNGEALIGRLEAQARAAVAESEVPGVEVRLARNPLARVATLSGPANDFQREGMGQFPGLNDRVREIEGIARIEWASPPPAAPAAPAAAKGGNL